MKLMTKELKKKLPGLYGQNVSDPVAYVKYFLPGSGWEWYGIEFDPASRVFFGLVVGFVTELGYFALDELETLKSKIGLPVERDLYFEPKQISEIKKGLRNGSK